MYFFISEVKVSLQMDKFPGNDLAEMPIFSHHGYEKWGLQFLQKSDIGRRIDHLFAFFWTSEIEHFDS